MSEFVDVEWFGRDQTIGIVLTYDEFDGFKVRMAPVSGMDEHFDAKEVMERAAKIPFEWAWGIFGKEMKDYYLRNNLNGKDWPLTKVRYDHRDYDVSTLEELK